MTLLIYVYTKLFLEFIFFPLVHLIMQIFRWLCISLYSIFKITFDSTTKLIREAAGEPHCHRLSFPKFSIFKKLVILLSHPRHLKWNRLSLFLFWLRVCGYGGKESKACSYSLVPLPWFGLRQQHFHPLVFVPSQCQCQ